ncbi:FAD:protein FMN transferase [Hyphomonas johnsonii]|uniref:FAD:protein FMN transferase n=1 Tax=Hyphomonas johnsonii MHS-2 TaxID=1280950 RepID=A0A059FS56_9PROT|nr:FAD:protein FMN transferase [Hyphomonas johnsonii]KCZ93489.1 thiamine biosynthesis lipoprotein [Hyphomonas johnsonii MHS-2]
MLNLLVPHDVSRADSVRPVLGTASIHLRGETMGTNWSLACHAPPRLDAQDIRCRMESVFDEIIHQMSTWEPDSLISRFNRLPPGTRMDVPPAFRQVLAIALDVAQLTDGAFNPCLGAEVARRGFGPDTGGTAATDGDHAAWRHLALTAASLTRTTPALLDLSGVAKGYAVDEMGRALRALGITSYLADIGGEFTASGVKPDGLPWWVDIETPTTGPGWRVALCGRSIATSGDYRKVRFSDGERVSHIVSHADATHHSGDLASVTVLHASCALADAWATGLFAGGAATGLDLATQHGLAALFQFRNQPARASPVLAQMLA